jgi:hypothetical protein
VVGLLLQEGFGGLRCCCCCSAAACSAVAQVPALWTYMHSTAPWPKVRCHSAPATHPPADPSHTPPGQAPGQSDSMALHSFLSSGASGHPSPSAGGNALAGFGVGLPMSRLYARYFGGDLDIKSLEGHGTDCFLHLNRLGHKCENLPDIVRNSPGTWCCLGNAL